MGTASSQDAWRMLSARFRSSIIFPCIRDFPVSPFYPSPLVKFTRVPLPRPTSKLVASMEAPPQGYRRNVGICLVNPSNKVSGPRRFLGFFFVQSNRFHFFVFPLIFWAISWWILVFLSRSLRRRGSISPEHGKCLRCFFNFLICRFFFLPFNLIDLEYLCKRMLFFFWFERGF